MDEPVPVPHVSLRPLAAWWFARRVGTRELREHALHARTHGRPDLAEQLEEASAQLRAVEAASASSATSDFRSAEADQSEVESELETSSSLGTRQVAALLDNCSTRWVTQLIKDKKLKATWQSGRWMVDRDAVDEYLNLRSAP